MSKLPAPQFEDGRSLLLAGLQKQYTPETAHTIPALWQQFMPSIGKVPGQVGESTYGVNTVSEAGAPAFSYTAAVEVTSTGNLPDGFITLHVPAYRYAVFPHEGHVSEIARAVTHAMEEWLPASGLKLAAAHPGDVVFFERYSREYNPQTGLGGIEICFPLQP